MSNSKAATCAERTADCFIGGNKILRRSIQQNCFHCGFSFPVKTPVQCTLSGLHTQWQMLNISCCLVSALVCELAMGCSQTCHGAQDHFCFKLITKDNFSSLQNGVELCMECQGRKGLGWGWGKGVNHQLLHQQLESTLPR